MKLGCKGSMITGLNTWSDDKEQKFKEKLKGCCSERSTQEIEQSQIFGGGSFFMKLGWHYLYIVHLSIYPYGIPD